MRRLHQEERGFTLIELLTAMAIATIVCAGTFSLVEVVMKRSNDITNRVDTTQRARTVMDQITRQLRAQVCTRAAANGGQLRSLDKASPTSISVYADLSSETRNAAGKLPAPDLRTIAFDATARTFTETVTKGVRDNDTNVITFSGTATTRRLMTNVAPALYADPPANTKPVIFRFYRYPAARPTNGVAQPTEEIAAGLNRELTADELSDVARIDIDYRVLTAMNQTAGSTALDNTVYVRTSNPGSLDTDSASAYNPGPTCTTAL